MRCIFEWDMGRREEKVIYIRVTPTPNHDSHLILIGFKVINLGVNITAEQFVAAVKEHKPSVLAMSSLMTMTAREQEKVIHALEAEGLRDKIKIMVGGGAITQEFADKVGADGYAVAATGAADLAKRLIGRGG